MIPSAPVIFWCEICNAAPATGVLTILRTGEVQTEDIYVCTDCVLNLKEDDWIDERKLP